MINLYMINMKYKVNKTSAFIYTNTYKPIH